MYLTNKSYVWLVTVGFLLEKIVAYTLFCLFNGPPDGGSWVILSLYTIRGLLYIDLICGRPLILWFAPLLDKSLIGKIKISRFAVWWLGVFTSKVLVEYFFYKDAWAVSTSGSSFQLHIIVWEAVAMLLLIFALGYTVHLNRKRIGE